jgi:hypothetical protein
MEKLDHVELRDHCVGELDEGRHDPFLSRHRVIPSADYPSRGGPSREILQTQAAVDDLTRETATAINRWDQM